MEFLNKSQLSQQQLLEQIKYLIITRGENGTIIYGKDKEVEIPPAKAQKVLDPTGAGDAFRGGLLKGLINYLPIEESVFLASLAGCYAVEAVGTQSYHYTISDFKQRFQENYGQRNYLQKIFS